MSSRPNQGRPPDHSSVRTLSVRTFFRCDFAAITNAASTQAAHRAGSHDLETCVGCTAFACVIRGARRSTVGQAFTGVVAGCMSSRESASTCRVLRFRNMLCIHERRLVSGGALLGVWVADVPATATAPAITGKPFQGTHELRIYTIDCGLRLTSTVVSSKSFFVYIP